VEHGAWRDVDAGISVECLYCVSKATYAARDDDQPYCLQCLTPLPWVAAVENTRLESALAESRSTTKNALVVVWPKLPALRGARDVRDLIQAAVMLGPHTRVVALIPDEGLPNALPEEPGDLRPYDVALYSYAKFPGSAAELLGSAYGQFTASTLEHWARAVARQGVALEAAPPEMLLRLLSMYENWVNTTSIYGPGSARHVRAVAREIEFPEETLLSAIARRHQVAHPEDLITKHEAVDAISVLSAALALYRRVRRLETHIMYPSRAEDEIGSGNLASRALSELRRRRLDLEAARELLVRQHGHIES
jgi:hypothetical protein